MSCHYNDLHIMMNAVYAEMKKARQKDKKAQMIIGHNAINIFNPTTWDYVITKEPSSWVLMIGSVSKKTGIRDYKIVAYFEANFDDIERIAAGMQFVY